MFRICTLDFFPLICYRYFTVLSRWKIIHDQTDNGIVTAYKLNK